MATLQTVDTRAAGTDFPAGKAYFETSTNKFIVWNGEAWIELHSDGTGEVPYSNQYSLSFDGSDDYLTMSPVTPTAQQGTISAWVKTTDTIAFSVFCWGSSATSETLNGTFRTDLRIRSGKLSYAYQENHVGSGLSEVNGSSIINDGQWHHVAVTSNGSAWSLYVDGSPETLTVRSGSNSGNWVGDLYAVSSSLLDFSDIGMLRRDSSIGNSTYFSGSIDELAVWDSALSAPEIASLIDSSGANPVPANISSLNPSAWWRMGDDANDTFVDGGSVSSITDSSGNGNTATQATAANQPTFSTDVPA